MDDRLAPLAGQRACRQACAPSGGVDHEQVAPGEDLAGAIAERPAGAVHRPGDAQLGEFPVIAHVHHQHVLVCGEAVGQVHEAPDAAVPVLRALHGVHGQAGPPDVPHEQRIAREHRPGLGAAAGVDEQQPDVLGPMARQVQRLQAHLAKIDHRAVVERLARELRADQRAQVHGGAGGLVQATPPGHVIGGRGGLDDVRDAHAPAARRLEVRGDVPPRVDHRGLPAFEVAHQV
ncbi:MAG: hypothetical protein FJW99_01605 [Actinobacteria bacterium]|nr:hypothetical protein [Actinomycetota bacterium]